MNLLFLSNTGDLLPLAVRARAEGHTSSLYIHTRAFHTRGADLVDTSLSTTPLQKGNRVVEGMVEKVMRELTPDLVVCDGGMGKVGDAFHVLGARTWGASLWSDMVNSGPAYARQLMASVGAAPYGDECAGWWDGQHFLYHHTVQRVRGMMNEGAGADVLAGVIVRPASPRAPRFTYTLGKMEKLMRKTHYRGPLAINQSLVVGFDLPPFAALFELLKGELVAALMGTSLELSSRIGGGVRVSVPPYPFAFGTHPPQSLQFDPHASPHLWLVDVKEGQTTGLDGATGWVSAQGDNIRECRRRIYRTVAGVRRGMAGLQYRSDAVRRSA